MKETIFLIIGIVGNALQIVAFWPQISQLYKEKDSKGVSIPAWLIWLFGDVLLFTYALYLGDPIFISLTALFVFFTAWATILIIRFKPQKA